MNFSPNKKFDIFFTYNFFCHVLFKIIQISNTYISNDFKYIVHITKFLKIIYTKFLKYYTL